MNNKRSLIPDYFRQFPERRYKKKRMIMSGNEPRENVFYIEKGYISAYKLLPGGCKKIYLFYKSGEFFPITSTFSGIRKNLFYETLSDTTIRKAPKEELLKFVDNNADVLQEIIDRIIENHNVYINRVDNLEYTNAYSRLISRILFLAERFGKKIRRNVLINIPVTHEDIANSIAMTRETASREIERLLKKHLIKMRGHLIIIPNILKLQRELDDAAERTHL